MSGEGHKTKTGFAFLHLSNTDDRLFAEKYYVMFDFHLVKKNKILNAGFRILSCQPVTLRNSLLNVSEKKHANVKQQMMLRKYGHKILSRLLAPMLMHAVLQHGNICMINETII